MFEVDKLFAKRCIPILEFCIPMPYIQYANEPTFHPATDSISSSIGNRSNRHSIKHFIQEILDNVNRLPNDIMRIHTNFYQPFLDENSKDPNTPCNISSKKWATHTSPCKSISATVLLIFACLLNRYSFRNDYRKPSACILLLGT